MIKAFCLHGCRVEATLIWYCHLDGQFMVNITIICTGFHQLANYFSVDNLHKDFMDLLLVEQAAASW